MRSLWSGVSGLNAHQVAMDVESNNIANVNTTGFKYSRTNFQDLLSQTVKASTAPQGNLGGKNSLQVGLGTSVSSVETMYEQGSIQNTDKSTDMAISGEGFFVVSSDGGKTYSYTRAGDFTFDSNGNFVDPNGMIVQGWLADETTSTIDTASGLSPIQISPGLTTPAKSTSTVAIKANLNSGDTVSQMSGTVSTLLGTDDLNGTYNVNGDSIELTADVDILSLEIDVDGDGVFDTTAGDVTLNLTYGTSSSDSDNRFTTMDDIIEEVNALIKDTTGDSRVNVYLSGEGQLVDNNNRVTLNYSTNSTLAEVFEGLDGAATASNSIKRIQNSFIGADDVGELFNDSGEAINLEDGQGISVTIDGLGETRNFVYVSTAINSSAGCGGSTGSYQDATPTVSDSAEGMHWTYDSNDTKASFNTNEQVTFSFSGGSTATYVYGVDFQTIDDLCCVLNTDISNRGLTDTVTFENGMIQESDGSVITGVTVADSAGAAAAAGSSLEAIGNVLDDLNGTSADSGVIKKSDVYYFHDIQDLQNLWDLAIEESGDPLNSTSGNSGSVTLDDDEKISITNTSSSSFNIEISGYPSDEQDNELFTDVFSPINGTLAAGGSTLSQSMNAATHTTSIDVYDSLGSKHTLTVQFRKTHTSESATDLTEWEFYVEVPEPSTVDSPQSGYIKFNADGSLNSFNPPSIIFNPNNGAGSGQAVQLDFGSLNEFDGLTSFDGSSATSSQSQDGYAGGDLEELVVDQTGTIIGVFTNGRSYSLAQVALAKFVNNEGLMSEGSSLYSASANSGEPIIGTASTGGRGSIQPSSLEMSNVDLSTGLTQLIVIQRGYQANSKTITTSDEMLNTLLQLK